MSPDVAADLGFTTPEQAREIAQRMGAAIVQKETEELSGRELALKATEDLRNRRAHPASISTIAPRAEAKAYPQAGIPQYDSGRSQAAIKRQREADAAYIKQSFKRHK